MCVFYVSGRLSGGRMSNHAVVAGGSAKERPSRAWGEGESLTCVRGAELGSELEVELEAYEFKCRWII